jgi:hypothetical protein
MSHYPGCIADANFLLLELSLSAGGIRERKKNKANAADLSFHGPLLFP